jgi:hypothetical protein
MDGCVQVQATPQEIKEGALSLIASYDGDLEDVGFTLTVYSTNVSLSWDELPTKLPFCHKVLVFHIHRCNPR